MLILFVSVDYTYFKQLFFGCLMVTVTKSFPLTFNLHLIFISLKMDATFPWHHTLTASPSSSLYSNNIPISCPINDASTIGKLNYCISVIWSPLPYFSINYIAYLAFSLALSTLLPEYLWIEIKSIAIVPKEVFFNSWDFHWWLISNIICGLKSTDNWCQVGWHLNCWISNTIILSWKMCFFITHSNIS